MGSWKCVIVSENLKYEVIQTSSQFLIYSFIYLFTDTCAKKAGVTSAMTLPPGVSNRFVRLWHPHCICRVSCIHPPGCWYRAQALTTFSSSSGKKMRYGSSLWKSLWTESTSLQSSASHCRHLDGRKKKKSTLQKWRHIVVLIAGINSCYHVMLFSFLPFVTWRWERNC